jgi:hypothetical protein
VNRKAARRKGIRGKTMIGKEKQLEEDVEGGRSMWLLSAASV